MAVGGVRGSGGGRRRGAGALLARPGRSAWGWRRRRIAAVLTGGLLGVGVPVRLLVPGAGEDLRRELSRGLAGVSDIELPYSGQPWTRFGILAGAPLALAAASSPRSGPPGEGRGRPRDRAGRLVVLYGVAVTWK